MKKIIAMMIALALVACFAACGTAGGDSNATGKPAATDEQKTTNAPVATDEPAGNPTDVVTDVPTDVPEPTATKEPAPGADIDAVLIDFEVEENYTCYAGAEASVNAGEPWLTIVSGPSGGDNIVLHFDEGAGFDSEEYPFIAFKYRVGYGHSVRGANHLYAITGGGGPTPNNGWWYHLDYVADLDWHTVILEIAEAFPETDSAWRSLRTPTVDAAGGDLAYAWMGAFKSAEDAEKYDAAFNEKYGDKLVKAEPPKIEKTEVVPELVDAFEETVIDFEDMEEGTNVAGTELLQYVGGLNNSVYVEHDGGIAAQMQFDSLAYYDIIKSGSAYSISFDLMNASGGLFGGFIFNWGDEGNTSRNFFEDNGLVSPPGLTSASSSGCGFSFAGGNQVVIYVPFWDSEAIKLSVASVTVEAPVDFNAGYNTFRLEDDGTSKVEVYLNDALFVTVAYADEGFCDAPTMYEHYYRSVTITGSDGTELLKTDKAAFSIYKSFAFAGRAHQVCFDNISFKNK